MVGKSRGEVRSENRLVAKLDADVSITESLAE
jgi:hypothetical protein